MIIKNGIIVSPNKIDTADILIEKDQIVRIKNNLNTNNQQIIDAGGKYILPGLIDAHTHMGIPIRNTTSADDFASGTMAALHGGVTTIIDFTVQQAGDSLGESIAKRRAQADGRAHVDFSLHCNVTALTESHLKEIPDIVKDGILSFKCFTAYGEAGMKLADRQILELLWAVKQAGGTVMFHAENGDLIDFLTDKYLKYNRFDASFHASSRPAEAEIEAVSRIITLNQFILCPVYFVHLTTAQAAQIALMAKQSGQPVYLETCPQYLLFDRTIYDQPDGHRYIAAPPFRTQKDIEFLWQSLAENLIDVVATDHCPFTLAQKDGGDGRFDKTPNGLPGVETLFPILYGEGFLKKRLSLEQIVRLIAEEPARLFGLYPRKGVLLAGSDADLVIFNPDGENQIQVKNMHSNTDWSPYEGMKTQGRVESVMLRGQWLLKDGELQKENLYRGKFLQAL